MAVSLWSILPDHLLFYEVWAIRFFLFAGVFVMLPWIVAIVYDIVLYIFRTANYEIPWVGGRARGAARPQPPNLHPRALGGALPSMGASSSGRQGQSRLDTDRLQSKSTDEHED